MDHVRDTKSKHSNKFATPQIISILGPRKTGKTTLLKSIANYFLKNFDEFINGPLLIFSQKQEPLILIESPLDTLSISNLAKVSDVLILVIDGFFGLELETFEFISFLNSHGTPRVLVVLTHMDLFLNWKKIKKTKKRLTNRLKKELGQQLKLFYLSGLTLSYNYLPREISNMTRFLSISNFFPSTIQNNSSYVLILNLIMFQKKRKEKLILSGFLRGNNFEGGNNVKIQSPGIGSLVLKNIIKRVNIAEIRRSEELRAQNKKQSEKLFISTEKNAQISVKFIKSTIFLYKKIHGNKRLSSKIENSYNSTKTFRCSRVIKHQKYFLEENLREQISDINHKKSMNKNNIDVPFFEKKIKLSTNLSVVTKNKDKCQDSKKMNVKLPVSFIEIELKTFPGTFFRSFEPCYPFLLYFLSHVLRTRLMTGKVYRHKWNKKIVRSRERVFMSMGWNFFRTSIYFFSEKEGKTTCLLKYLKKSLLTFVCFRSIDIGYETGLIGIFQSVFNSVPQSKGSLFNILFTGTVLLRLSDVRIFKKIKIEGMIFKKFKKTCFVKNMFSHEIEVHRFIGQSIRGEEGEKGIIKKPLSEGPCGSFRAVFDRNLTSKKKVYLRMWTPLKFRDIILYNFLFFSSVDKREIVRKSNA